MSQSEQKNWFRRLGAAEEPSAAGDEEVSEVPVRRIAAYAPGGSASFDTSSVIESYPEHDVAGGPPPQRSAGEEVDAILQTARDSAAKLVAAATEEADRTRAEAKAAASREFEQARQRAEAEREEAAKLRAGAEAHAVWVRNEAETEAERLRAEADEVATSLVEDARAKLAAADLEAEQRMKAAEDARARTGVLQAEARRHEERLKELLADFRQMSLQIEAVLEVEGETGRRVEPAGQDRAA
jgi:hypothetical protein